MDIYPRTPPLRDLDVDALLAGRSAPREPELQDVVALLRSAADAPVPAPNAALAAVLAHGLAMPATEVPARPGIRRWVSRGALVLATVVVTTTGAATANALPAPLQSAVAEAVRLLTPLELPRPEGNDNDVPGPVVPTSPTPPTSGERSGTRVPQPPTTPVVEEPDVREDSDPDRDDDLPRETNSPSKPNQPADDGDKDDEEPAVSERGADAADTDGDTERKDADGSARSGTVGGSGPSSGDDLDREAASDSTDVAPTDVASTDVASTDLEDDVEAPDAG